MTTLSLGDFIILCVIGLWAAYGCMKLFKSKRSGQCIGCSKQCKVCQYNSTNNKQITRK